MSMVLMITGITVVYILVGIVISVFYYLGKKVQDKNYYFDPDVDTDEMFAVTLTWPFIILVALVFFIPKYIFDKIFICIFTALNESYKAVTEEEDENGTNN